MMVRVILVESGAILAEDIPTLARTYTKMLENARLEVRTPFLLEEGDGTYDLGLLGCMTVTVAYVVRSIFRLNTEASFGLRSFWV